MQKVVIDADFFRHTTEYENGTLLFEKLMRMNGFVSSKKVRVKVNDLYDLLVREYATEKLTWKDLRVTVPKVFLK